MEKLAKDFIKQIRSRNKIDLTDKKRWFSGAYSTFQRPLSHIRAALDSAEKQDLQNLVQGCLGRLDGNFDVWIRSLIFEIRKNHNFPIGCAQKLINILTKYYYVSDLVDLVFFTSSEKNILKYRKLFHCPIDNYVLYNLRDKYPSEFSKSIQVVRKPGKKLGPLTKLKVGNNLVPWSRLNDYELYIDIQKQVRKMASIEGYQDTLAFEMKKLWKS
jgi:hypothetical protein